MTDEEIGALLLYFRDKGRRRDELILWILHACALRPGELFGLRWNDWDGAIPTSPKDVQGQIRHTEARMSLYYGKVIPPSLKQEVNRSTSSSIR